MGVMNEYIDALIEASRAQREAFARIAERRMREQLGEAFRDLPTTNEEKPHDDQ